VGSARAVNARRFSGRVRTPSLSGRITGYERLAMRHSPDSTLPSQRIPSVVLISPAARHVPELEQMLARLPDPPSLRTVELSEATTVVAECRPFAVLIPDDVFAFDPNEFEALARDVGAEVIAYDGSASPDAIRAALLPKLREAFRLWERSEFAAR